MATDQLTISLLGPFQVTRNGSAVTRFGSDTARALLAYLVMHPGVAHRRDALAGLLWPELANTAALRNLRVALSRLRDAIGDRESDPPLLVATRRTVQSSRDAYYHLDVQTMRDVLAAVKSHDHAQLDTCEACIAHLQTVANLYRGDFLAGFSLDSPAFEEWLVVERENCHWQALEALSALTTYYEQHGDFSTVIECARRQVELEPWRESAHHQWIRALASTGHRGAALAQFDACRAILADELGVEPEAETLDLVARIRGGTFVIPHREPATAQTFDAPAIEARTITFPQGATTRAAQPPPVIPVFPEGERRTITVVQAAIGDLAKPGPQTEAGEWAASTSQLLHAITTEVRRYGGDVDRYDENGLTALFGAQAAHEDDPERGVLAALAMHPAFQTQLEQFTASEAANQRGATPLRVAVHTGEVIVTAVGSNGAAQRTVIGEALLAAGQILARAAPGEVRVSEATYHLVAPLFTWHAPDGAGSYVPLAHKRLADKGRGVPGMYSDLVGRDRELHTLNAAVARLHAGIGGIVTLVGEAGIGKSRLVAEARDLADVRWVEGRCLSYSGTTAYVLWQDVLRGLLGVKADTPPAIVHHALRAHVRALDAERAEAGYAYLGHLLSVPLDAGAASLVGQMEPENLLNNTFYTVERILERTAQQQPLVIVCEDLHWADPTSLALLEYLLALTDRVPLLLVCIFRPQREHGCWRIRETALRTYPHRHTDVQLQPLSTAEGETLIENLLLSLPGPGGRTPVEGLPATFKAQILSHGEGNPFYVEEILRALIHNGVIVCEAVTCRWEADEDTVDIGIPETLYGVLRSRIDQLPTGARHLLHLASVVGRIFPKRLLAAIAEREGLEANLVTLQREQLIRERTRLPEAEYIFQHQLTLEAAYGGLLQRVRRTLHRRVAVAIEQLYEERIDEQLGLLAQHWEQAGDIERTVTYLRRAGEQAAAKYASDEALSYFERALALVSDTDLETRYEILLVRERVYFWQGNRDAQGADLEELEELTAALADPRRQSEVALRQSVHQTITGHRAMGIKMAQKAVALAQAVGDHRREILGYMYVEGENYPPGQPEKYLMRALHLARKWGLRDIEAIVQRQRSMIIMHDGQVFQAKAVCEEAYALFRELGDHLTANRMHGMFAIVAATIGDYEAAQNYQEQALRIFQEAGDFYEGGAWNGLGRIAMWRGDFSAAEAYMKTALKIYRRCKDPYGQNWVWANLGRIRYTLGDYANAQAYCERAYSIHHGNNASEGRRLPVLALLARQRGDHAQAYAIAEQALEITMERYRRFVLAVVGHTLIDLERWEEAREAYAQSLALWERMDLPYLAAVPLAGLARIAYHQGDIAEAMAFVERVLICLEHPAALFDTYIPFQVYLTAIDVLRAAHDNRAGGVLCTAYADLMARASKIEDKALRRSYLENVAENREIVAEYAKLKG